MFEIKIITTELTYKIRQAVLRIGKPIESCFFEGDNFSGTVHFGLFIDNKLKGVVSLFKNSNSLFLEQNQYQIRGMAVLDSEQGKGYGKLLIEKLEHYLQNTKTELIWFNAREVALKFYQKCGYEITGKPFEIDDIGKHYLMYKKLL